MPSKQYAIKKAEDVNKAFFCFFVLNVQENRLSLLKNKKMYDTVNLNELWRWAAWDFLIESYESC